jgi:hypothetical protein
MRKIKPMTLRIVIGFDVELILVQEFFVRLSALLLPSQNSQLIYNPNMARRV